MTQNGVPGSRMKALIFHSAGDVRLEDTPEPEPEFGAGEVLCDVARAGICGTDLLMIGAGSPVLRPGHILGHEGVLRRHDTGERVVANPLISCGICATCQKGLAHVCARRQIIGAHRNGFFAERVVVPDTALIPAEHLTDRQAAMVEPLAVAFHAVALAGPGDIAVLGAGPIGLCVLWLLKTQGRTGATVTDLSDERLAYAERLGAKPERRDVLRASFDAVIDCVGAHGTRTQAVNSLNPGGRAVLVGGAVPEFTFRPGILVAGERAIVGSFGYTSLEFRESAELARSFDEPWVIERDFDEAPEIIERMRAGVVDAGAVKVHLRI